MATTVPRNEDRTASIADRLNRLRKEASISVETLSATTGISKRTLDRKLTAATGTLTLRELFLIADALNVRLSVVAQDAS